MRVRGNRHWIFTVAVSLLLPLVPGHCAGTAPEQSSSLVAQALSLEKAGKSAEAIKLLAPYADKDQKLRECYVQILGNYANGLVAMPGRAAEAEAYCRTLLKYSDTAYAWVTLARALRPQGRLAEGQAAMRNAQKRYVPNHADHNLEILSTHTWAGLGNSDEAMRLCERLRAYFHNRNDVLETALLISQHTDGKWLKQSADIAELCLERRINPPLAYRRLCEVLLAQNKVEDALRETDTWLKEFPADTDAYIARSKALRLYHEPDQAMSLINVRLEQDPKNSKLYCERGRIYAAMLLGEQACAAYTKAIELDSSNYLAYLLRAECYRDLLIEPENARLDFARYEATVKRLQGR